ncbi:Protein BTN1 [Durusdinium trenchii]|uniref:Protein BTN1 n=1 Tax=Durusdinium trenchii TaxID=1381693 RepID=A0ABP0J2R6_9DINO
MEPLSSLREYRSGLSRRSTSLGAVRGVHAERESRDALVPRAESPLARRPFEAERQRARSLAGAREVPSRSMAGRDREAQMISEPRVREASFLSEPSPHIDRRMEKFEVESRPNRRSLDLETRAQQRQRNWGTLRSSWLVKNCFSSWRSFVAHQVAAARTQRQQELQISTLYELQTSLAKKEEEIKRLLLEMERNEQAFLKQEELLQAELRLLRQRLRAAHEDVAALQYRADQALLMARTFDLWHRAVLSNPKEILLLQQRIEELEEALKDAEHQRRRSENEWRLKLKRAQEEMEALQRELQEELERRQRRIEELEEALSDAEQQMRRSENEWRLKLKRAQEEMDALRRRLEEEWSAKLDAARGEWGLELDNSKNVFELQLEKVHKQHEAQKKLQEEEDAVKNRKLQLQMEELRRKQLEAKQNAQMRTMSALMGKGAKGALSLAFVAWVRYLAHAKQEKKDKELELALDKKDQELQKLLKDQQALNRSLKDRQKEFDLHCRNSREEATARAHHLLGGDGLSYREALWLSQVLSAWLLVATALHWARARELYAGQADQLRLQLEELRREKHLAMRDKLLFSRELRENQALVSRVLHEWLRLRYHGTLEAHGERADQLAKNLRARQELLLERACLGFGMKNARQLLRSCFKAWHARRRNRFEGDEDDEAVVFVGCLGGVALAG